MCQRPVIQQRRALLKPEPLSSHTVNERGSRDKDKQRRATEKEWLKEIQGVLTLGLIALYRSRASDPPPHSPALYVPVLSVLTSSRCSFTHGLQFTFIDKVRTRPKYSRRNLKVHALCSQQSHCRSPTTALPCRPNEMHPSTVHSDHASQMNQGFKRPQVRYGSLSVSTPKEMETEVPFTHKICYSMQ